MLSRSFSRRPGWPDLHTTIIRKDYQSKTAMMMLDKAFSKTDIPKGLILHSDQGWHYQHLSYQKALKDKGIVQSMSRKGNCLDNAMMENFFGLMKSELLLSLIHI